jgi:hypothetical protein
MFAAVVHKDRTQCSNLHHVRLFWQITTVQLVSDAASMKCRPQRYLRVLIVYCRDVSARTIVEDVTGRPPEQLTAGTTNG